MSRRLKIKSYDWRLIKRHVSIGSIALLSACILSFAGSYPNANPTLAQIDANWRTLYGSPVHQGIVVFNKMSGGTNDVSKDSLCIMHLISGSNTAVVKNLMKYVQWAGVSGWGVSSTYRISHDGAKIAMQNGSAVSVCDTDGTNLKVVSKPISLNADQLNMSWDDSAGIRRIVYSAGLVIIRTVVNADNSAGKTDTVWAHSWGKDPSAASSNVYTSVNKVGNFLSFNMPDNVTGNNDPIVANLATKTSASPTASGNSIGDGCQIRMLNDGLGTVSYHPSTHLTGAKLWRWPSTNLGTVPCPNGQASNCTDCGVNMFYWCDSDTNFMVEAGDNQASVSPGCYTKSFIRKGKTSSANMMYLGDYLAFPALWIDPNPFVATGAMNTRIVPDLCPRISVQLFANNLTLKNIEGGSIDNAVLTSLNGTVVARGDRVTATQQHVSLSSLHAGMYLLSWHEGNGTMSKYVTLAR